MKQSFARRLMLHSVVMIGGSLVLLTLVVSVFIFYTYVRGVNAHAASVVARLPEALRVYRVPSADPDAAVRAIVAHVENSGLSISAANTQVRVEAVKSTFKREPKTRAEPFHEQLGDRLSLGLATALGLQSQHTRLADVEITVSADAQDLDATVRRYAVAFIGILIVIGVFAFLAARALTREALRPLREVVGALESFAAGDLRPRRVEAAPADDEFRQLAVAYNGAIDQVSAAFGERDRAQGEIRRFIADAAHQLRTPLTVVQGFIGILLKGDARTEPDRARILQSMDRQSRLMAALIEKLMLLDRWQAEYAKPEVIDIGDYVRSIVSPFAAAAAGREIALDVEPDCYVRADPSEINEAVGNVVDNAFKYAAPAAVSVRVQRAGDEVRVEVSDRGPGLSRDEREHAFDRFYRGPYRDIPGSGLGLSIASRAAERAGGRILLESVKGAGTTFTIVLPRHVAGALPVG